MGIKTRKTRRINRVRTLEKENVPISPPGKEPYC